MKKMYVACFFILGVAFTLIYYTGYQLTKISLESETKYIETTTTPATTNVVLADKVEELIVTRKTSYILETYLLNDNTIKEETLQMPIKFLGYKRTDLINYLNEYMKNLNEEEKEEGLVSFELVSFSSDVIVLRKTFHVKEPVYLFYLEVERGNITVYQISDNEVYAYTDIKMVDLPDDIQLEIMDGKYIENIGELYEFLETYSS
ncbi:MAG: hypothetical protein GX913_08085 [Clostridiales bacterium]|nr:hypothetical protein [Clostridiales bacterium]